ncbi:aminoglycoside phosphotransferase (APT) family kinase protein [Thermocatellispora tengchongensis]|uniref:Aminoglycoside phosphotransferase (APT) family kinase protein n=1 Tax=Thermocatellispora tengchongensis TaxID=1073253 RepID=A0A840PKF3_9ACTN|nr:phosphotransferase family protein [Thermocatellispora tengchongensis]MBB5136535.1 aminoglycoside phosphotransferase (APT) family kinase protein [Thermocatellispora tengchongensis]
MNTPGIDWPKLVAWMGANAPAAGRPVDVSLLSGGRSNLTYLIRTDAEPVVLRRPPLGHVLPTAHDMSREWRVISALAPTPVPVPEPVAFCGDEDVIGAPFYLMGHVDGAAIRDRAALEPFGAEHTRRLAERLAEILAAIHAIDYRAVGLGDFGRPEGYMARQLRRWNQQWERSATRELPEYDRLVARLTERLPAHASATLLHGDFRLDNTLVGVAPDGSPEVRAVVDWEMSTLGDPLADLGLTLTYWQDRARSVPVSGDATLAPGFLDAREFAAHYAKAAGADLAELDFYLAFGCFKLAVIIEGIHARYIQGKTVGEGFEHVGEGVPVLVARAHRILDGS